MSAGATVLPRLAAGALASAVQPLRPWLPPVRRREFWAVQALVVLIAGGHALMETVGHALEPRALYLLPASLYFVPVVYAALNFGLRGSLATALWSAALTVPNIVLWHTGLDRVGEIWQTAIVLAVAIFVGQRVDRETTARREAEEGERERRSSEARYRGLFENAAEAVLLIDEAGTVVEANTAASRLLGRPIDALRGAQLASIGGPALATQLVGRGPQAIVALPGGRDGRPVWVEPILCSCHAQPDGTRELQVMLHDVTLQQERQQGLEEYARRILAAREEERRRIGRELHDGPLQLLVLLWRKLDQLDGFRGTEPRSLVVTEARDLAQATAKELRRISRALRPSVLDDLGLTVAIKSEAVALAHRSGIAVRFVHRGAERRLESEVELMLLRIAQEALHNVERHAGASKVLVRLAYDATAVRLLVQDNGRGLDPATSAAELLAAGKLGLVGIQERARLAGAECRVRSPTRGGTLVEVTVPQ